MFTSGRTCWVPSRAAAVHNKQVASARRPSERSIEKEQERRWRAVKRMFGCFYSIVEDKWGQHLLVPAV